jgi:hypothetical protein
MDRFNPLSFRPSAEPGSRYRLLTAGCHGCPIGLRPRPDDPLPLVSSRSLRHDMAEATDKSKQEEHTAAANLSETPEKQKNIYMTISLSQTGTQELRFAVRTNCDLAYGPGYTRETMCEMMIL